jgi:outer membrane protein OmpA-like peptidoglycan-associated protein
VGLRLRPFASSYDGSAISPAGLWLSATGGVARTGSLTRPMFDAQAGFDILFDQGRLGVGPSVGLLHVFQPNDALRPDDANVLFAGLHVVFDTGVAGVVDADRDGDGIRDSRDECPDDPEDHDAFEDEDGCPDLDNDADGVPDLDDVCPLVPEDRDGFEDDNGCPDPDNDGDGLLDSVDQCPNDAEDEDGFEDEDGCPDPDNDQDGILDREDACPDEPETFNDYADEDGCPDSEQIRVVGDEIFLDDRIHFRVNSPIIRRSSHPLLERLARLIEEHPEYVRVEIYGHADARGSDWFNERLSQQRAESVLAFLVERGISRDRLFAKGFGSEKPLVDGRGENVWFQNRRVEFKVIRAIRQRIRKGGPKTGSDKTASTAEEGQGR